MNGVSPGLVSRAPATAALLADERRAQRKAGAGTSASDAGGGAGGRLCRCAAAASHTCLPPAPPRRGPAAVAPRSRHCLHAEPGMRATGVSGGQSGALPVYLRSPRRGPAVVEQEVAQVGRRARRPWSSSGASCSSAEARASCVAVARSPHQRLWSASAVPRRKAALGSVWDVS